MDCQAARRALPGSKARFWEGISNSGISEANREPLSVKHGAASQFFSASYISYEVRMNEFARLSHLTRIHIVSDD